MALDARAVQNIATAPATRGERIAAIWAALAFVAAFGLVVAARTTRLAELPAFVPTVASGAVVALVVTAIIFYLQYRVARDGQLAVLAYAYVWAAAVGFAQLVAFPNLWGRGVAFGWSTQTSAWLYGFQHGGLAVLLLAFALIDRAGLALSRAHVRWIGVATLAAYVGALTVALQSEALGLPRIIAGLAYTALWTKLVIPFILAVFVAALAVQAASGTRTVTRVWIMVVTFGWALAVVAAVSLPERFSIGWYEARVATLVADLIVLAVFLVKFHGLLERLAATSFESEARYRALTNAVPQLIWTTDEHGNIDDVNERWSAYTNRDAAATRSADWRSIVHPAQAERVRERWRQASVTGDGFTDEVRLQEAATGRYRWFLVTIVPQYDARRRIARWIGTATDIDANKRIEERDAFVARAGERLGASLDTAAVLSAMKALVVPRLAEQCEVELLDDDGRYVLGAFGSVDIRDEIAARRQLRRAAPPEQVARLERVARLDAPAADDDDPHTVRVALRDRGDLVGVLTLRRERPYESDDVGLVRDLAARAATALRHASIYERERTTADALQRAMLPTVLPQRANVGFSASYSAASESQRVGGDFYDAFALADGRVAMTIGDVTGHGLEAAVIMGEIRQAIRAASFDRAEPSAILDRASRLLEASGRGVFVTAVFGVLDPATGAFVYATAGHPPPLVFDGDDVVRLAGHGLPLGLRGDDGMDFGMTLRAASTLVMFTDGLLEFNRDLFEGERRIEAAVRDLAGGDHDHLAGALMQAVLGRDEPSDDIAILTATIGTIANPAGDLRSWRFAVADGAAGALVRHDVGELIERAAGAEQRFAAEIVIGELLANVVRHAPGMVEVRVLRGAAGATLIVEDEGPGFTPPQNVPGPMAESGRGLALVRELSSDVTIAARRSGGASVTVRFGARSAERVAAGRTPAG